MNIDDRLKLLLSRCGLTSEEIAKRTGIPYSRLTTIRKKGGRARAEETEIIGNLFPEYKNWLHTGDVTPAVRQTSPELEDIRHSDSGKQSAG